MKNRKKAALLFVSPMTKTERQVIEVSHAPAWGKNKEHKIIYQDISSICFTYISTEKKRHGPREVNTHVFHIREIKRGYNELQLLVLFKLSDASFFFFFFFSMIVLGTFSSFATMSTYQEPPCTYSSVADMNERPIQ